MTDKETYNASIDFWLSFDYFSKFDFGKYLFSEHEKPRRINDFEDKL
jgi:hypothetical protein